MQVKCNYCGSFIDEALETCPNCGAPNENIKRAASGVPRTIEELKAFTKDEEDIEQIIKELAKNQYIHLV
jgi:uncharacterized OB-fold protein